ncbi:uncharacterized protein Z520_01531 [Fonsecaea multimorphosa CBS 102226]|uniref:FAD/NAD(P)-binding domain-containing protein n=1 Tax=Fonsecaea multimorphosa CBS 102226 TaxID=1442371 RepID=A0A0D2L1X1_9EURO|nr:uncharacterized protein Z520_01531 [Fonsecaea multimorphosa CBS 102226]KIY03064.1 hypothetical protein Z520_01531 [Fonsecaea multimorphosa CBS 102226]OAL30559.1 hypothetical protein AYO22_01511 [Fonsecaea multimorphosa]
MTISQAEPVLVTAPPALSLKPQMLNGVSADNHENEWYRTEFSSNGYQIQEQPLNTQRPMHVLIIGAGAAGLQIAYKALRQLKNVRFTIYEKNADVGGTWLENRYPGCTCDIPSHSYQFSFWRKPDWKSYYSGAEEIRQYLKDFAVKNDLEKFVRFRHKVQEARWDQERGVWQLKGQQADGSDFTDEGEILASCHGVLNSWKYPNIPGIESFKGKILHSAAWDDNVVLEGKRVAVVGGGSSAVQIIPSIQPQVEKLYAYLRSPVWITAGFGAKHAAPGGVNFDYTEEQKAQFARDPSVLDTYCRDVEGELNKRFTLMHLDSVDQKSSRDFVAESMFQKLGGDERLSEHLIPKYALGCRRMTPGSNYLQSLLSPNVQVVPQSAVEVTPTGLIDSTGNHTEVDVIIFATGFDTSFSPAYKVVGQNGRTLREEWKDFPKAYLSLMARGFPNMFHFPGPNGPASHGSVLPILEWHTRYLFKVISHMQRTFIKSLEPSAEVVADLYIHTHELLKRTAWSSACRSWFKNGKIHGPVTAIWPGSRLHYFEVLKEPRYEDFDIQYMGDGNRFAFLGNGYTETELDEHGNPVWYFDVLGEELALGTEAFAITKS